MPKETLPETGKPVSTEKFFRGVTLDDPEPDWQNPHELKDPEGAPAATDIEILLADSEVPVAMRKKMGTLAGRLGRGRHSETLASLPETKLPDNFNRYMPLDQYSPNAQRFMKAGDAGLNEVLAAETDPAKQRAISDAYMAAVQLADAEWRKKRPEDRDPEGPSSLDITLALPPALAHALEATQTHRDRYVA